jgi:hypothetical protein
MELRWTLKWLCCALLLELVSNSASAAQTPPAAPAPPAQGAPGPTSEDSKSSPSHLTEFFYLNGEVGAEYVGLESLHLTRELVPSTVSSTDVGPLVGVGAGIRLVFLNLGPRFRYGHFRDWDLWTLNGELGFRAPLGAVEPYLLFGAGFAKLGRLQGIHNNDVRITGYDIRLGAGFDYYFGRYVSLGAFASGEVLGLTRPGAKLNESTGSVRDDLLQYDGSSVGAAGTLSALVGLHL